MADSPGPVERAVRKALRGRSEEPLVQLAYALGRAMDRKPIAATSVELRATLGQLGVTAVAVNPKDESAVDEIAKRRAARLAGSDAAGS